MADIALINGTAISWGDLIWTVQLPDLQGTEQRFYGFSKISFGEEKRERPPVWGQNRSQAPMALPAGQYTPPTPSITWIASSADADSKANFTSYIEFLRRAAPDGRSYGNVRQNWILQVDNPGSRVIYAWQHVVITGGSADWEATAEALKREMTFGCLRFSINGATMYDSTQEV